MISCDCQTTIKGFTYPITINYPTFSRLSAQIDINEKSRNSEIPEDDLSIMISRLKSQIRNGSIVYPAIGDFVEIDYRVIRSKFFKSGPRQKPKVSGASPMISILPMHAPKGPGCGTVFWHGTDKVTLDFDGNGNGAYSRVRYQTRSCHSPECEECGDKAILDKAWEIAQRIEASQAFIRQYRMESPRTIEIVFSPPQATKRELAETLHYAHTIEGFQEFEYTILEAIRQASGDSEGLSWGAMMFYHAFRQNGTDGQKNGWNGNDGNPDHWREAPHFHVIFTSSMFPGQLIKAFNDLRRTDLLKGWIVKVGPKEGETEPRLLSSHSDLENKLQYILSHTAIRHKADKDGQAIGRRLPMFSCHGLNHHSRISRIEVKSGVPLLNQGYADFIEDGETRKGFYWARVLYMCLDNGLDVELARVERINSAHVYVPTIYRNDSKRDIVQFVHDHPEDLGGLWRMISSDRRYITNFVPKEGCPLRYPNRMKMIDGGDLRYIVSGGGLEDDLTRPSEEYLQFCEDSDRRDAELISMGVKI